MIPIKILVADDDEILRRLLCDILTKQGYEPIEAVNGQQAIDKFFNDPTIALVILDVMMPLYTGWEVLKLIRVESDVPIMMLTALGDEANELTGLLGGANDYLGKPFSYEIMIARINSLLRKELQQRQTILKAGKLLVDQLAHRVYLDQQLLLLNNKEYGLLVYFMKNPLMVLSREKLINSIWGYDFEGDVRTVDVHIKMLRNKLENCGEYIKTIRGSGYSFEVKDV